MATIANFTLVAAAFAAAESFAQRVDALRDAAKKDKVSFDPKAIKAWLAPSTAQYYKVQLVTKERGEGSTWNVKADAAKAKAARMALPKGTPDAQVPYTDAHVQASETAKKQNDRLAAAIIGVTVNKERDEVEIPAELLAAAAKLAKLAAQYEGARSLASKALAQAFTQG